MAIEEKAQEFVSQNPLANNLEVKKFAEKEFPTADDRAAFRKACLQLQVDMAESKQLVDRCWPEDKYG